MADTFPKSNFFPQNEAFLPCKKTDEIVWFYSNIFTL